MYLTHHIFRIMAFPLLLLPSVAWSQDEPIVGADSTYEYLDTQTDSGLGRVILQPLVPAQAIGELGEKNATSEAADVAIGQAAALGLDAQRIGETELIVLELERDQLEQLINTGLFIAVYPDRLESFELASAGGAIGIPSMHAEGAKGLGQAVVVIDTGVDSTHPALSGRVVSEACFSSNSSVSNSLCPNGAEVAYGVGSSSPCRGISGCDHGTHVAGIIAGSISPNLGVAPEAKIVSINVFSKVNSPSSCGGSAPCLLAYSSDVIDALDYVRREIATNFPVAAVNMSLGGGKYVTCAGDPRASLIGQLRSFGIATVIASGNNGYPDHVSAPACIPLATTVGAASDSGTVAGFSNSGESVDLMAPGVSIQSTIFNGVYGSKQGTSMAAPMVAGAIAALRGYWAVDVNTIEQILKDTGTQVPTLNVGRTRSYVNMTGAINKLKTLVPSGEFVWMKDTWSDLGREPDPAVSGQALSASPYVWVRYANDCQTFPHQPLNPEFGQLNFVCAMIHNDGNGQSSGTLQFYYARANFDSQASWTLIAETRETLPGRHRTVVSVPWANVPNPGHYCIIVRWVPDGENTTLNFPGGFVNSVRNENDLVWRNVNIFDANKGAVESAFHFVSVGGRTVNMVVDISLLSPQDLEEIGKIIIALGGDPSNLNAEPTSKYYKYEGRTIEIPLKSGVYYLPDIVLPGNGSPEEPVTSFVRFIPDSSQDIDVETSVKIDFLEVQSIDEHKIGQEKGDVQLRYQFDW